MKIITRENYFDILARYIDEYKSYKAKKKGGFLPPATDTGTQVGKLYARTILNGLTLPTTFWRGTEARSVSTTVATPSAA